MDDTADIPAYIAIAPCGCVRMATVDVPKLAKDNAKEIAACLRFGWRIERVTVGYVRSHGLSSCDVCEPPRKRRRAVQQEVLL